VDLDAMGLATSYILGDGVDSLFAFNMALVGDLDGDGYAEVLVREAFLTETTTTAGTTFTTEDMIWVLSGAELAAGAGTELAIDDVRIQEFDYEVDTIDTGNNLKGADLDGDGSDDILISAYAYPGGGMSPEGKVYVYLSSHWGW
jgi:hypothetical protein